MVQWRIRNCRPNGATSISDTALTGVYPASGEMGILRRSANDELEVAGTLETD